MIASSSRVVILTLAVINLAAQNVNSQIPAACADDVSLRTLTCCPNNCGNRGTCTLISHTIDMNTADVRRNWPHYYTHVCNCNGNYAGVDCLRCKYGYYGPNCENSTVLPRQSIQNYSQQEMTEYHRILQMARSYDSGYKVVVGSYTPGTTISQMTKVVDVNLYTLFIWTHHYAAKDNYNDNPNFVDYAHESTGFLTWHRQFMLWLEWEIQYMLKSNNDSNYHTFRLAYWDWRRETLLSEPEGIFTENKLGVISTQYGQSVVMGDLFGNWSTVCWYDGSGEVMQNRTDRICDPEIPTGPLLRCPSTDDCDPRRNTKWPNSTIVNKTLEISSFDTPPYNESSRNSFRNLVEGFEPVDQCESSDLCTRDKGNRHLHNAIHIILGLGNQLPPEFPQNQSGVMGDVAASPNDPIFINHHAMIDCIFEMWLQKYSPVYPDDVPDDKRGHQRESYLVPFFPLFKHQDMMMTANNFGYSCALSLDSPTANTSSSSATASRLFHLIMSVTIGMFVLISL